MIVVRYPAVQLLFQKGNFTANDTYLVALSTAMYSAAIWAFGLQQILNRAYYALHDTMTPLIWGVANLAINTIVEIPLLWTHLHEAGMAVGTLVSFSIQAVIMLWMLDRRCGGLQLNRSWPAIAKMLIASALMCAACLALPHLPIYPHGQHKITWAIQLCLLMGVGGLVYFGACAAMGMDVMQHVPLRRTQTVTRASCPWCVYVRTSTAGRNKQSRQRGFSRDLAQAIAESTAYRRTPLRGTRARCPCYLSSISRIVSQNSCLAVARMRTALIVFFSFQSVSATPFLNSATCSNVLPSAEISSTPSCRKSSL